MGCGKSKSTEVDTPLVKGAKKSAGTSKKEAQAENDKFNRVMLFAHTVPLFRRLPKDQVPTLALACDEVHFKAQDTVITEGSDGHDFFTIQAGEAEVHVGGKKVATLKKGDFFGESSLLHDEPRSATVIALTKLSTLKITREKFQELGLMEKLHFPNRKAVGDGETEHGRQVVAKPPSPKTPEEQTQMEKALEDNINLKSLALDKDTIREMVAVAWKEEVQAGKTLIQQGDIAADYFYIVAEGAFDITVADSDGNEKKISTATKGSSFGELALMYVTARAATVKCAQSGSVWVMDRHNWKMILAKKTQQTVAEHAGYLDRVELLRPLSSEERNKVANALSEVHFKQDDVILKQGDAGNAFYILFEGTVAVIKDGAEQTKLEACHSKETAHVFGERALLNSDKRAATVKVVSESAKAFALDRDDFNVLLGPLKDLLGDEAGVAVAGSSAKKDAKGKPAKSKAKASSSKKAEKKDDDKKDEKKGKEKKESKEDKEKPRAKILRTELNVLGLLGCGGFGRVEMAQHNVSGECYALKAVSKGYILQTGMKDSITNEKMILSMTNSKFVVKLYETYNSDQNCYFLLELALGGELYATYNRRGFHGKENYTKFYAAGVVFAFEHCHFRHVIYRDLKPENLLLTETGHIKLTDMGLAKFVVGTTYTTCGTPDYFAPELIKATGHTVAIDWWGLGILIYELQSGNPPFEAPQPMQTYSKAIAGIEKVVMHPNCNGAVESLVKALLKPDPADRLGMIPGGIKNIQEHVFFATFDWQAMEKLELEVPYKPKVSGPTDCANFKARDEDRPPQINYKDDGTGWDKDFASSV